MNGAIITGVFTLAGVIVGVAIGIVATLTAKEWKSKRFRIKVLDR